MDVWEDATASHYRREPRSVNQPSTFNLPRPVQTDTFHGLPPSPCPTYRSREDETAGELLRWHGHHPTGPCTSYDPGPAIERWSDLDGSSTYLDNDSVFAVKGRLDAEFIADPDADTDLHVQVRLRAGAKVLVAA